MFALSSQMRQRMTHWSYVAGSACMLLHARLLIVCAWQGVVKVICNDNLKEIEPPASLSIDRA